MGSFSIINFPVLSGILKGNEKGDLDLFLLGNLKGSRLVLTFTGKEHWNVLFKL